MDFQSTALPTELPSHAMRDHALRLEGVTMRNYARGANGNRGEDGGWTEESIHETSGQIHGGGEKMEVIGARDFDGAELLQMGRDPLGIQENETPLLEVLD